MYTNCTQIVHKLYTNCTQIVHKLYTNCTQILHKLYTKCTQTLLYKVHQIKPNWKNHIGSSKIVLRYNST